MRNYIKRALHFDFHSLPKLPDLGDDFDAKDFAEKLSDAKVEYINFFARCNLGHSYYPTKVGIPHPYLKNKDIYGDLLRECHKKGIGVTAYLNASLCHAMADIHRDWNVLRQDGRIMNETADNHAFRSMCYDSPYGEHLLAEIKEILELYPETDGIFVDCFSFPPPCFCPVCMDNMKKENVNIHNKREVINYNERKKMRMAEKIRAIVPKDKKFIINSALRNGTCIDGRTKLDTHSEIECLVCDNIWGYDYFPVKVAYERNLFDNVVFMSGRFRDTWGDFGGIREISGLEYDMYLGLLNCAEVSIGDHLHPRGRMEKPLVDMVKKIYTDIEKTEKWTHKAKYISEIGILHPINYNLEYQIEDTPPHLSIDRLINSFKGCVRILAELKYQYDIIDDTMDFDKFKVIILPDAMVLTENAAKKLEKYLDNGGKVISSGQSGLKEDLSDFALKKYWNFKYMGKEPYNISYFKAVGDVADGMVDMVSAIYSQGIALSKNEGNEILGEYWEPYFNKHYDGHQYYSYIPYDKKSDNLYSVLKNENVIHINFKLFEAYYDYSYQIYRTLIDNCIKLMYKNKIIKTNLPVYARASVSESNNGTLLQTVTYFPEKKNKRGIIDEKIKLYNSLFEVKCEEKPKKIYTVPDMKEIEFTYENGYAKFNVPEIDGHEMVYIEN